MNSLPIYKTAPSCKASVKQVPMSHYKLCLVANLIRGMSAKRAGLELSFSNKKGSYFLKKVLDSCVANAENNHRLDISKLFVTGVFVGKSLTLRRFMARGRGRSTRIEKRYSSISIILSQIDEDPSAKKKVSKLKKLFSKK